VGLNSVNKSPSAEAEMELSDSASSTLTENSDAPEVSRESQTKAGYQEFDYVKDLLANAESASSDSDLQSLVLAGDKLNPLLFDKLEGKRIGEDKDGRMRRKVLFDCVNECLDLKYSRYFSTGYRAWSKGSAVVGKENFAKEIYDEISGWKSMGDWMVDELVDKDMSGYLGKWVDYEIEAFEAGLEIENEIVNSLVDEMIADCFTKGPCLL